MELFSTAIQKKLHVNLSAFQYFLIKQHLSKERLTFSKCKKVVKKAKFDLDGIYAFESMRFPTYFLDAYGQNGSHAEIRLVQASVEGIDGDPWGWFKVVKIDDKTYAFEAMRYPGYFLDAYGKNGAHAQIRLVQADPQHIDKDPWGWFTLKKIRGDIYAFACQRYPGYFLDAYGKSGHHASIRLVNAAVDNIGDDPWGWFAAKKIDISKGIIVSHNRVVAIESKRFAGYFLDAHSASGPHADIRLVTASVECIGPWGWFTAVKISEDIFAFESKRYPGFYLDAHSRSGSHAQIRLVNANVQTIGGDPWGWFTEKRIDEDTYAFESRRYPGYFLDAHSANGRHAQMRLVKASVEGIGADPWGWFSIKIIS